uniref:Transcriptional regulator, AraC family n=1 Tax=Nitratidesulfovibrio vulgaris (strain DSM 19637 / Miyazaki F) TaxID=883 RepID=B8DKQ8_NITV9
MPEIAELMSKLAINEGKTETGLPGVGLYRTSGSIHRTPLLYQQGLIILGQGAKLVHFGGRVYQYDQDHYLALSVPIAAECEAVATPEKPLLSLVVDIDLGVLNQLIGQIEDRIDYRSLTQGCTHQGLFLAKADAAFRNTVQRLLLALSCPLEAQVLGPGLVRELLFRVLCGENAAALHALATKNTNMSRIEKALKQIHGNFSEPFNVDQLAGFVNMSPSTFHRAFKDVTAFSPIQYLKRVRLNKARSLLREDGVRASEAARMVGYESVSQFSREFRRYFGISPSHAGGVSGE